MSKVQRVLACYAGLGPWQSDLDQLSVFYQPSTIRTSHGTILTVLYFIVLGDLWHWGDAPVSAMLDQ